MPLSNGNPGLLNWLIGRVPHSRSILHFWNAAAFAEQSTASTRWPPLRQWNLTEPPAGLRRISCLSSALPASASASAHPKRGAAYWDGEVARVSLFWVPQVPRSPRAKGLGKRGLHVCRLLPRPVVRARPLFAGFQREAPSKKGTERAPLRRSGRK